MLSTTTELSLTELQIPATVTTLHSIIKIFKRSLQEGVIVYLF